jgi:hypothetical protein
MRESEIGRGTDRELIASTVYTAARARDLFRAVRAGFDPTRSVCNDYPVSSPPSSQHVSIAVVLSPYTQTAGSLALHFACLLVPSLASHSVDLLVLIGRVVVGEHTYFNHGCGHPALQLTHRRIAVDKPRRYVDSDSLERNHHLPPTANLLMAPCAKSWGFGG